VCGQSLARWARASCVLLLLCGLTGQRLPPAVGQDSNAGADQAAVIEAALGKHVAYLASDELRGRDVGTEGLELAAQYIARAFEQAGVEIDSFDGTPFQTFNITRSEER